uniref:FXa inhibitor fXaI n=2 Tax=Ornithodoros kalahariensis TaxID=1580572 RepID=Q8I9U3_ORNKA|nr:fXa inhibitor fXaI [Ornithodoros kalahariensis]
MKYLLLLIISVASAAAYYNRLCVKPQDFTKQCSDDEDAVKVFFPHDKKSCEPFWICPEEDNGVDYYSTKEDCLSACF